MNALGETVRVLSKPLQCRFAGEQEYVRVINHAVAPTTRHALTGLQCEHRIRAGKHRTVEVRIREKLLLLCGAHEQIRAALMINAPTTITYDPPLFVLEGYWTIAVESKLRVAARCCLARCLPAGRGLIQCRLPLWRC